jgi:hypothetical protein
MSKKPPPIMTEEEFVGLLTDILKEKKQKDNKLIKPYDMIYDKCLLGYEVSRTIKTNEENVTFKTIVGENQEVKTEAHDHLKYTLESLVKLYGKLIVIDVLKKI